MTYMYMYMATPQPKSPCPRGIEIYNSGRPLLAYHYCMLSLSDLCLGEGILKKIHFHYMTYILMTMPQHKNPCPGGHEIYNFGSHFYILS